MTANVNVARGVQHSEEEAEAEAKMVEVAEAIAAVVVVVVVVLLPPRRRQLEHGYEHQLGQGAVVRGGRSCW